MHSREKKTGVGESQHTSELHHVIYFGDGSLTHRKATAMRPLRHRPRGIGRQQAAAHEDAQQPPAHALLHRGEGLLIQPGGGMEDDPARGGEVEHTVDDEEQVLITATGAKKLSSFPFEERLL